MLHMNNPGDMVLQMKSYENFISVADSCHIPDNTLHTFLL